MNKIFYINTSCTIFSEKHFYKMHRIVFFNKFILTIDIYPELTAFGFMIACTKYQWTWIKV